MEGSRPAGFRESLDVFRDVQRYHEQSGGGRPIPEASINLNGEPGKERSLHGTRMTAPARCVNVFNNLAGNLFQLGALVGATLLTAADLSDRHKDAIGGMTIGCIALGTFCFWQLSCCHQQSAEKPASSSYSQLPAPSTDSQGPESDEDQ